MNKDYEPLSAQEMQDEAMFMAARMRFYNSHDVEDAAQDAIVAMLAAGKRAKEGMPVRRFQRKSGKCAILTFYNEHREYKSHVFLSLTKLISSTEEHTEYVDLLPDMSQTERKEASEEQEYLSSIVDTLPEKEREVIRLRFYKEKTLEEAGKELGITKEYVRQIEEKGLARLRQRYEHPENIPEEINA